MSGQHRASKRQHAADGFVVLKIALVLLLCLYMAQIALADAESGIGLPPKGAGTTAAAAPGAQVNVSTELDMGLLGDGLTAKAA